MNDNDEAPQVQPAPRKEIHSEKANVEEAQYHEVSTEAKEKKPQTIAD